MPGTYAGLFVRYFYLESIRQEFCSKRRAFEEEKEAIDRTQLIAANLDAQFSAVERRNDDFTRKFDQVSTIYTFFTLFAVLVLLHLVIAPPPVETAQELQTRALTAQVERFQEMGYLEIRAVVGGQALPDRWETADSKHHLVPNLTAFDDRGRLAVVEWVPCTAIHDAGELNRLRLLTNMAATRRAEVHLVTEPACNGEPGPEALRRWLDSVSLGPWKMWTF